MCIVCACFVCMCLVCVRLTYICVVCAFCVLFVLYIVCFILCACCLCRWRWRWVPWTLPTYTPSPNICPHSSHRSDNHPKNPIALYLHMCIYRYVRYYAELDKCTQTFLGWTSKDSCVCLPSVSLYMLLLSM